MSIVKSFYNLLPFNKATDIDLINQINIPQTPWKPLSDAIVKSNTVLELGCGQGWLSNRIARNYPVQVTAIDLVEENIERAKQYATDNVSFYQEDILECKRKADTVISVGVLHHIPNYNIRKLMTDTINKSEKYCFIGLYHDSSRRAMFDFFKQYPKRKHYKLFKKMTPWIKDEMHRQSWYRDQLEHPYEVTATLSDFNIAAHLTNTNLVWTNADSDTDLYNKSVDKISAFEFTSGFVYGLFEQKL